jgi:arginine repressor
MPDIKTEMAKVLDEWNKPETTTMTMPHQKITNNATRATFNKVAENPGSTRAEVVASLLADGYKVSSTTSLLTQLLARGNIRSLNGKLFANQNEYKPMERITPIKRRVVKDVVKDVQNAAPVVVVEEKPEAAVQINAAWDADTLLNNLSIKQARALYDELRKIFGG